MLDLSPSPPGGLSLFSTFQKEPPATSKSVADPGEGPGGPAPPYVGTKLRPQGPKKFCKIWIQHCKYYYFLCLALCLTCKKLKNNCISLNLFHFKAVQIHCSVFGVRSDIKATKE